MAGLLIVYSRDDPQVQVADLQAAVARRLPGTGEDGPLRAFLSQISRRLSDVIDQAWSSRSWWRSRSSAVPQTSAIFPASIR